MQVKVGKIGGRVQEVLLDDEATVRDALTAAGETLGSNFEARIGGDRVELDEELSDGDVIALVPKTGIKGGRE